MTEADGTYEFTAMPTGSIRITAAAPAEFEPHEPVIATLRGAFGCAEANVFVRIDGRIGGQLLDERGRPLRNVELQLADSATVASRPTYLPTLSTITDQAGVYEFRHVPPGRYVIGVGLQQPARGGKLDRRRFYGETRDPAAATVVQVGRAERLQLAPFKLSPLPSDRIMTIAVRAPTADVAAATQLFLTGATRESIDHRATPISLRLPFGAAFFVEAVPPKGYRVANGAVRIEPDDTDRTIELSVQPQ